MGAFGRNRSGGGVWCCRRLSRAMVNGSGDSHGSGFFYHMVAALYNSFGYKVGETNRFQLRWIRSRENETGLKHEAKY